MDKLVEIMPCLKHEGLQVFTQTPEQRLHLGEDWFSATHVPIQLREYVRGNPKLVSEAALFEHLSRPAWRSGNRVIILYGAAGSGKSELMTWLEQRFAENDSSRPVYRITRTELDILSIVNRFRHLLTGDYFSDVTMQRWANMRAKPRTLAKILTLRALERLLDSDEMINGLFFRLVSVTESQIARLLLENESAGTDILERTLFDTLEIEHDLDLPFSLEVFRQHLLDGFREMMLENIDIKQTLRQLSDHLSSQGYRPVLLIDDLVQSINLFATEFLDYFITLDQGEWDVVIGMTPAAFQTGSRERAILERVNHLDTIDDRVDKLWLSDEQGSESFFLDANNCIDLAAVYLRAFRNLNGVACEQCPLLSRCTSLRNGEEHLLSPFNAASIRSLFRGIQTGKGKVRAFIMTLRQVLADLVDGQSPSNAFGNLAYSELTVSGVSDEVREILKFYVAEPAEPISHIESFFGVDIPGTTAISALGDNTKDLASHMAPSEDAVLDTSLLVVRDWLENKPLNRQLLQPIRKGFLLWLRTVQLSVQLGSFHYPYSAQPNRILRDHRQEMDTAPPVQIEGIDQFDGIPLPRQIQTLAMEFYRLSSATGSERTALLKKIDGYPHSYSLLLSAEDYMAKRRRYLESCLGMSLERFAICGLALRMSLSGEPELCPPGWPRALMQQIRWVHQDIAPYLAGLPKYIERALDQLYDDFFKLRENIYDVDRSRSVIGNADLVELLMILCEEAKPVSDNDLRVGSQPLGDFVERLQSAAKPLVTMMAEHEYERRIPLSSTEHDVLKRLRQGNHVSIDAVSPDVWEGFRRKTPRLYQRIRVVLSESE